MCVVLCAGSEKLRVAWESAIYAAVAWHVDAAAATVAASAATEAKKMGERQGNDGSDCDNSMLLVSSVEYMTSGL